MIHTANLCFHYSVRGVGGSHQNMLPETARGKRKYLQESNPSPR